MGTTGRGPRWGRRCWLPPGHPFAVSLAATVVLGAASAWPSSTSGAAALATPSLMSAASPSTGVGLQIFDNADLVGAANPTGTLTFNLFGPADNTCATPIFSSTVFVTGGSTISQPFTTTQTGTYHWTATYSGDANNAAAGPTVCGDPTETVVVTRATVELATTALPSPPGLPIEDFAYLFGGFHPTGGLTFSLFGPDDPTCSRNPVSVSGGGPLIRPDHGISSGPFFTVGPGIYNWVVSYSGDANNFPAGPTACGSEQVVVQPVPLSLRAQASTPEPGGPISDTATLSGDANPTGTITFDLFGPDNASCAGPPIFTSTTPISGTGSYSSGLFVPTVAGTYRWVASYSGDADNPAAGPTPCGVPAQTIVVPPPPVVLTTQASADVTVGGAIHDTVTLSGGSNPTGTIAFDLFGPDNLTCTGTPIFTTTVAVVGAGGYDSASFTSTAPGTYRWVASYSGDAGNAPVGPTTCADPAESVVVTAQPAPPPLPIQLDGSADVASLPEPGGTFAGRVSVLNTRTDALTLTALADENLNGVGTCTVPQPLAPGGTYTCTFPIVFTGRAGDTKTVTVTATAVDGLGQKVTATDKFVLGITEVVVSPPPTGPIRPSTSPNQLQVRGPGVVSPPVVSPPAVSPPVVSPVVGSPLVRTGTDVARGIRLAIALVLAGALILIAACQRAVRPSRVVAGPRRRRYFRSS